jgi:type I site-specific restriction-modification system R (restriction) subunit
MALTSINSEDQLVQATFAEHLEKVLNPELPSTAIDEALRELTVHDMSRSMVQHNRDLYRMLRGGVPVHYRDSAGHHSEWEHFNEWKRLQEQDKGSVDAEVLLNGMLAHDRLLDIVENFILFDESKPGATQTKADIEVFILDRVHASLPTPPFTAAEKDSAAHGIYAHVWKQAANGIFARAV